MVPVVFILADLYWGRAPKGKALLRNWKLYAPIVAIPIIVTPLLVKALRYSDTAGFNMRDLPWNHYFLTQCRAVWVYLRLFLAPYGQNIDYDYPLSRSLFEHGAVFGLAGLLALAGLAFHFRKRFPLASFGYFVFLALLAPTSSLVPIRDVLVERRTYLPFIGLALIVVELLRFVKLSKPQLLSLAGLVIAALCVATYQRNLVWSDPLLLWRDAAEKSPLKSRPRFQYAYALYSVSQCAQSAREYEKAAALSAPDVRLLVDWAMALECNQQYPEAIEKLQLALAQTRTAHIYSVIGMIRARQGQIQEAWDSLDMAVRLDPGFPMAHFYRGNLHASGGDWAKAAEEYRTALVFNPDLTAAREGLVRAETNLAAAARKKQ